MTSPTDNLIYDSILYQFENHCAMMAIDQPDLSGIPPSFTPLLKDVEMITKSRYCALTQHITDAVSRSNYEDILSTKCETTYDQLVFYLAIMNLTISKCYSSETDKKEQYGLFIDQLRLKLDNSEFKSKLFSDSKYLAMIPSKSSVNNNSESEKESEKEKTSYVGYSIGLTAVAVLGSALFMISKRNK